MQRTTVRITGHEPTLKGIGDTYLNITLDLTGFWVYFSCKYKDIDVVFFCLGDGLKSFDHIQPKYGKTIIAKVEHEET
jgi:hypothetical protein